MTKIQSYRSTKCLSKSISSKLTNLETMFWITVGQRSILSFNNLEANSIVSSQLVNHTRGTRFLPTWKKTKVIVREIFLTISELSVKSKIIFDQIKVNTNAHIINVKFWVIFCSLEFWGSWGKALLTGAWVFGPLTDTVKSWRCGAGAVVLLCFHALYWSTVFEVISARTPTTIRIPSHGGSSSALLPCSVLKPLLGCLTGKLFYWSAVSSSSAHLVQTQNNISDTRVNTIRNILALVPSSWLKLKKLWGKSTRYSFEIRRKTTVIANIRKDGLAPDKLHIRVE